MCRQGLSDSATCAGAIHATDTINVAGGNVVIKGSAAEADGGMGSGLLTAVLGHWRSMQCVMGFAVLGRRFLEAEAERFGGQMKPH